MTDRLNEIFDYFIFGFHVAIAKLNSGSLLVPGILSSIVLLAVIVGELRRTRSAKGNGFKELRAMVWSNQQAERLIELELKNGAPNRRAAIRRAAGKIRRQN